MDEGQVISRQVIIACCDPTAVLDLVEEPFDQVACAVEVGAEADWLFAIASWRNVGPSALIGDKGSDSVRIIPSVGQHHRFRIQAREKCASEPIIVRFPGCQRKPHRQAICIDYCVNLAGQPAS